MSLPDTHTMTTCTGTAILATEDGSRRAHLQQTLPSDPSGHNTTPRDNKDGKSGKLDDDGNDDVCPITLVPFSTLTKQQVCYLPCCHRFEKTALMQYLRTVLNETATAACPVCKSDIGTSFLYQIDPNGSLIDLSRMDEEELEAERTAVWIAEESDEEEEDNSDDDQHIDSDDSIKDFIVPDSDEEEDEDGAADPDTEYHPPSDDDDDDDDDDDPYHNHHTSHATDEEVEEEDEEEQK